MQHIRELMNEAPTVLTQPLHNASGAIATKIHALNPSPSFASEIDFSGGSLLKILFLFLSGTLAAASGVGGGAVYTVLFIILYGLVYEAIPLSKLTVFGTAIVFFLQHYWANKKNNVAFSAMFAFDVVMIMEPTTLLGTVYGVLASKIVPYWLITIIMTVLLSFSATKTLKKASKLYHEETKEKTREGEYLLKSDAERALEYSSLRDNQETEATKTYPWGGDDTRVGNTQTAVRSVTTLVICFCSVVFLTFFELTEFDACGSLAYYVSILAVSAICIVLTTSNVNYIGECLGSGTELSEVTQKDAKYYAKLCFMAGFLSSLCGVGGSTIKGPIILHMGVDPAVSRATSQFMLLSTVGSSVVQFWAQGTIPTDLGLFFFSLSCCACVVGKVLVDKLVSQWGRKSIIVYLLGWYIVLAAVLMTGVGIVIILGQLTASTIDYKQLWFRGVCDSIPPDLAALRLITGVN